MDDRVYEVPTIDRLIACINQGDDGAEATRLYRECMSALSRNIENHGGKHKGSLTIKIEFEADAKGIDVAIKTSARMPAAPVLKERFFVSGKGDTLTAKDPGRGTLFEGNDLGRRGTAPGAAS